VVRSEAPAADLEVAVLSAADAENARAGGADRLHAFRLAGDDVRSMEPAVVSAIVRATDLPVRVTLRLSEGFTASGAELTRLAGLAGDYLSLGVEGFAFGFLTPDLEVDVDACGALAGAVPGVPWTLDRTFDAALDARVAWRQARALPGLDRVHTAGSMLGSPRGLDDVIALAQVDAEFAGTAVAAGPIGAESVPWLVRAGVTRLHLGALVRPGGSWHKAHVDPGFVRSWRTLVDDAVGHLASAAAAPTA
jgi:copper homeostasis protein